MVLLFFFEVCMLRSFQRSNRSLMIGTFAKPIDGQEESLDDGLALVKLQSARQRRSGVTRKTVLRLFEVGTFLKIWIHLMDFV